MATMSGASTPADGWQEGMNLLTAGKSAEAVTVLQYVVQSQPDSFEGHNYLGVALAQTRRFEEAIAALQKATRLNAQSAQARFNLGLAFEGANRSEAARKEFQSALQIDPKYVAATHALSRLDAAASTPLTSSTVGGSAPWSSSEAATQQFGAQQQSGAEPLAKPHILNILGGFALGLVAAIICAIVWDKLTYYTHFQIGYVAVGIGFVVGSAVVFGAGGKRGRALQVLGALLSLLGIMLGETLLVMDYVRDEIAKDPTLSFAGASPIGLFIVSAIYLPESFKESPLSILFAGLGLWYGWSVPAKQVEAAFPEATATDAPAPSLSTPPVNAPIDAPPPT